MQNLNRYVPFVSVASEITHLFCCGLPMIFSLLSLLTSLGFMVSMPASMDYLHHAMHDYEIPIMVLSAILISLGWVLHIIAQKIDCRKQGECSHEPCATKKKRSNKILLIATCLFIINLTGYFVFHY